VIDGCADNRSGTSEVPQLTDPLCATRKSAQVGRFRPSTPSLEARETDVTFHSPHNYLFLDGVKSALTADAAFADGWYQTPPVKGVRAFSRVYAGWLFSQDFFREQEYRKIGFASMEDAVRFLEGYYGRSDANDLLAILWTWQHADISANDRFNGRFRKSAARYSRPTV
jgi:hypothetical protein